jgi:thiol-disulfide isomerase/thioredoxin
MKRLALVCSLALILTMASVPNSQALAPSCSGIMTNPAIKKGVLLPCLDGKSSFIYQGIKGPAMINVWGSWCDPCKEEIPLLVQVAKTKKIQIIGIDVEEKNNAAGAKFVATHAMTWPQLADLKGTTKGIFGMGVPVTRFIDANGKAVYEKIGAFKSFAEIKKAVKQYLGLTV